MNGEVMGREGTSGDEKAAIVTTTRTLTLHYGQLRLTGQLQLVLLRWQVALEIKFLEDATVLLFEAVHILLT